MVTLQSNYLPELLVAGDFVFAPGAEVGPRILEEYEIIYFMNPKTLHYTSGQEKFLIDQPCIVLLPAGVNQYYQLAGGQSMRHQFVHFHPGLLLQQMLPNWPQKSLFTLENNSITVDLLSELLHISSKKDYGWRERCSSILLVIISKLFSDKTEPDVNKLPIEIQASLHHIESHLPEQISVKQLSQSVNWSHEHFTRVFKSHVGMSPNQYLLSRRIEKACKLIAYTTISIKEIAEKTGFQSEHYFSRSFKRLKSTTPSHYRKKAREYRHISEEYDSVWKSQHPINTYFFYD
ncbi:AraC family transcriptional regulator [Paenibacillus eucommiae]|uniref:AraC-like DNA-binding protein n=1 Tax=Paenibacillus eucommiae TaxID=1355755 RepID=A0ABS4J280_9BACL|nr:AraC family transcriptional regulator [Paenibacillus eucommiae]MBP1993935.1 AraC-like DNA-binding protein [Paenibacillus eucommiae]